MPWLHGESCCDTRFIYKPCCSKGTAIESDPVRNRMRERLRGTRFALVGDSLTRQWFEILTCFLGLSVPTWFVRPPVGIPARQPLHVRPHGFQTGAVAGYAIAGGSTTVEYFHFDTGWQNLRDILSYSRPLDFAAINFGIHYHPERDSAADIGSDILATAQECQRIGTRCVFRETFPQHFPTRLGLYDRKLNKSVRCQPLNDPAAAFHVYNDPLHHLVSNTSFPILKTYAPMAPAWDKHARGDCSHYCSDDSLWKNVHETLLSIL
jgi:hypothetical protein